MGGFWAVGLDKNLYRIEMPDDVKDCMCKNAKRYDIQTGKVIGYTNADSIRSMGNDGLAAWYCHDRDCRGCEFGASDGCHLLDWLKAPVEEVDNG